MTSLDPDNLTTSVRGRAKSTLTAFFDSRSTAETAVDRLDKAGVADVRLMPGDEADGEGPAAAAAGSGFWSRLGDWFFPDEDRDTYAEGLRRGGFLVSASVDQTTYDTAHAILDTDGSIDLDERADLWRREGWTTGAHQRAAPLKADALQTGAAAGLGRYSRAAEEASPRVRAYELIEELPDNVVDDVVPTGHQRDVAEGDRPAADRTAQSPSVDDLRQTQSFPGSR